ncbi:MAG: hypothetical protein WBH01_00040 [Dehalococcoidia bacterium]
MRAKYEVQKPIRNRVVSMILISVVLAFPIVGFLTQPVAALPAGFQEFFTPMPADLTQDIFVNVDNDPVVSNGMHYVVGVTASADNTVVYYDHWENGYGSGATGFDEMVALNKGEFHTFESSNVPSSPRGTAEFYDGGDRIFVSGSLLQFVVSTWPESPGTVFTDAWEVYPVQAWENQYVVPVGEAITGDNGDFDEVWIEVMSGSDGNSITVIDGATSTTVTRNKGATYTEEITDTKATVSSTAPVQVHVMTGAPNSGLSSEMRGFTATPQAYWSNNYYAPVPSWTTGANSNLWLYNPDPSQITVNWEERFASGSFTIDAGATRSYFDGTGHYVPTNSGVHLSSSDTFWGIGTCDTGSATYDWGYALIPFDFLGTDNYLSWSPGTSDKSANGSPVYIMATTPGTTIYIDYGPNDGVWDQTLTPDWLQPLQVRDLVDNDNTGMHIVSTAPVAICWGESPNYAGAATPYLDMGYTALPLPVEWIDVALEVGKSASPTTVPIGEETTFTIVISASDSAVTDIDLVDTLPPGWTYVVGSTTKGGASYDDPDSITLSPSGDILTWDDDWDLPAYGSLIIAFRALATSSVDTVNPNRNIAEATGTSVGATLTSDDDAFVTATPSADLSLTKDVDDPTPDVGSNVTFTIVVSNGGPSDATGVSVTDVLPYGLTFVSANPAASYNSSSGVWTVGNLTNGANATLTIVATVSDLGGSGVTNTAIASAITIDPNSGNNAASAGVRSPSSAVGYNVFAVNKVAVIAPWIASAAALMAGCIYLVRRRVNTRR